MGLPTTTAPSRFTHMLDSLRQFATLMLWTATAIIGVSVASTINYYGQQSYQPVDGLSDHTMVVGTDSTVFLLSYGTDLVITWIALLLLGGVIVLATLFGDRRRLALIASASLVPAFLIGNGELNYVLQSDPLGPWHWDLLGVGCAAFVGYVITLFQSETMAFGRFVNQRRPKFMRIPRTNTVTDLPTNMQAATSATDGRPAWPADGPLGTTNANRGGAN